MIPFPLSVTRLYSQTGCYLPVRGHRGDHVITYLHIPGSDVFDIFARLKSDGNLSDEEAFLKFMTTYDVTLGLLNQISSNVYHTPFIVNFFLYLLGVYIANAISDS
jgi:hypothetical protein